MLRTLVFSALINFIEFSTGLTTTGTARQLGRQDARTGWWSSREIFVIVRHWRLFLKSRRSKNILRTSIIIFLKFGDKEIWMGCHWNFLKFFDTTVFLVLLLLQRIILQPLFSFGKLMKCVKCHLSLTWPYSVAIDF